MSPRAPDLRGLFITGVDTGVGKTVIGAAIVSALRVKGVCLQPRKPAESACEAGPDGRLLPADALKLWEAAGKVGGLDAVCKYAFAQLAASHRAARLSGRPIYIDELAGFCREGIDSSRPVLVEGAGGFYSPMAEDGLNADLAVRLGLPVLLVALDKLGCINQILLTAEAIANRGLTLCAVVLNVFPALPEGDMDNAADLKALLDAPIFRVSNAEGAGFSELVEHLATRLVGQASW